MAMMQRTAVMKAPSNTGLLRNSIKTEVGTGGGIGLHGKMYSPLEYAPVMEFGRKPGTMPPVDQIERWASLKLHKQGLGYVIARSIANKGIKGHHFFQAAADQNRAAIERLMERTLGDVTRAL